MLVNTTSNQSPMRPGVPQSPATPNSFIFLELVPLQPFNGLAMRKAGDTGQSSIIVVC